MPHRFLEVISTKLPSRDYPRTYSTFRDLWHDLPAKLDRVAIQDRCEKGHNERNCQQDGCDDDRNSFLRLRCGTVVVDQLVKSISRMLHGREVAYETGLQKPDIDQVEWTAVQNPFGSEFDCSLVRNIRQRCLGKIRTTSNIFRQQV